MEEKESINLNNKDKNVCKIEIENSEILKHKQESNSYLYFITSIELLNLSWPNFLTYFVLNVVDTFTFHFLRGFDPIFTSAFAIGFTVIKLCTASFTEGLNTGIDALVSRHFGMKDYRNCSVYLYIGFIVANIFVTIGFIPEMFSYYLLLQSGISKEISEKASRFAIAGIFYSYFVVDFDLFRRFLTAQKITRPQFCISTFNGILQIIHCYFFIQWFGYLGVIYSMTLTNFLNNLMLIFYTFYFEICKQTLYFVTFQQIKDKVWIYLNVAIPGGLNIGAEYLVYQIITIFSATLGIENSAANGIFVNLDYLMYSITMGVGSATCACVGNSIGAKRSYIAKIYSLMGILLTFLICISSSIMMIIFEEQVASFFSENFEIKEIIKFNYLLVLFSLSFENLQGVANRILIAIGYQRLASIFSMIIYFPVMIPMAYILKNTFSVSGIWMATSICYFFLGISEIIIITRMNYNSLLTTIDCVSDQKEYIEEMKEELIRNPN